MNYLTVEIEMITAWGKFVISNGDYVKTGFQIFDITCRYLHCIWTCDIDDICKKLSVEISVIYSR